MKRTIISISGMLLLGFNIACQNDQNINPLPAEKDGNQTEMNTLEQFQGMEIQEAASYKGLQVFLLKGQPEIDHKEYTTLDNAMKKKMVTVKETGNVGELSIKNTSNKTVYLHSGDIVKGGKQDRTVANDMIIPPHSKDVPLKSFCVEQSRWQKRGNEDVSEFSGNTKMLSSKELKYAAKYKGDQSEVWDKVAKEQGKLSKKVSELSGKNVNVQENVSGSSLQLALENKELKNAKKEMANKFKDILVNNQDAVGYAYAINGKVYGAETFNNRQLMKDLWGKLSESVMDEAAANIDSTYQDSSNVKDIDVAMFMAKTTKAQSKASSKQINKVTDLKITETDNDVLFSTVDKTENNWLHRSYMEKEEELNKNSDLPPNNHQINQQINVR